MTQAAVYLRISQDPTGEAAGVTRQREDCLRLVESMDWELFRVYEDNDISASSGKVRPEYTRMLADIKAGHIDSIVAWHPDRLYRKLRDLEGLIEAIESRNVVMRTVRAGEIDLSTPTGRMLARILSATAQAEGEVKADRWMRSWRQGRERGNFPGTGSRMFGYTRDGQIVPDEAEAARRMAKDIVSGGTILGVARWLEDEGIPTTRGTTWRTGTVRQYLANPRIAGYSTLKGDIVGDGTWEPLIDRETWETVRALLTSRARGVQPRVALLNGLIFCGKPECGERMITGMARKGRIYRCPSARPGFNGCGGSSSYAEPIEEIVESYARERLSDPRVVQRIAMLRAGEGAAGILAEINALEARLLELEAQLDEPGVPVDAIMRGMSRTRDRLEDRHKALAGAARAAAPLPYVGGQEWPTDLAQRRHAVVLALGEDRVYLDPAEKGAPRAFNPARVRINPAGTAASTQ